MEKEVELRKGTMQTGKAGGTSGKDCKYYRAIVPPTWAKAIGITEEDREIELSFDGETIVIRKSKSE